MVPPLQFDLVLCSDCLFWESLHRPLAEALVALLSAAAGGHRCRCAVAYQRRNDEDSYFFDKVLPEFGVNTPLPLYQHTAATVW